MIKPIGKNVLIKIIKPESTGIELIEGSTAEKDKSKFIIEEVSEQSDFNLKKGHEVIIGQNGPAMLVKQTKEYDLAVLPESSIKAILNYNDI